MMDWLLDLLFPRKCVFCRQLLEREEEDICADCRHTLPVTPMGGLQKLQFIPAAAAPFYYEDAVKESLQRYKFGGRSSYAPAYAPWLEEAVRELPGPWDTLSWVPLSRRRLRKRGYDQAQLLAEELGGRLGMEAVPLLVKHRDAPPQSRSGDAAARRANISGCYMLQEGADAAGKRILLVDDIVTTGATLSECARMLKLSGAEEVYAVTMARSR